VKVKTAVFALIIVFACITNTSCASLDDHLSKEEIIKAVNDNIDLLNEVPDEIKKLNKEYLFISTTDRRPIEDEIPVASSVPEDINGLYLEVIDEDDNVSFTSLKNDIFSSVFDIDGVMGIDFWDSEEHFSVTFDCGGTGFGSATSDFGFYYAEDNVPICLYGSDEPLARSGDGWTWQDEENSDNIYYTERITDNWFYYRMDW